LRSSVSFRFVCVVVLALLALVFVRTPFHGASERNQHASHLPESFLELASLLTIEDADATTALELIVGFVAGGNRDSEITRELSLSALTCALRNVVGDRIDRSQELRAEAGGDATCRPMERRP
jgi:hypothetical protein